MVRFWRILLLFNFSYELNQLIIIQAAMPAAMIPIVLSKYYKGCPETAFQVTFSTTLLGLITIPLWIRLGSKILGY